MKVIPDNAQSIGQRARQEDSFAFSSFDNEAFIQSKGYLTIVADGMGGMTYGKEASETAVSAFLEYYHNDTQSNHPVELLHHSLHYANKQVRNLALEKNKEDEMGTTLVATVIFQDFLYWISVGDSRIYLFRNGELTQLTEDHQYQNLLYQNVMNLTLSKEEADNDPQKRTLTSFIGLKELLEIDFNIKPIRLRAGDRILLCTDGLYEYLPENEIKETLQKQEMFVAKELINKTLEKNHKHQDNVTVTILTLVSEIPNETINTYKTNNESKTNTIINDYSKQAPQKQKFKITPLFLISIILFILLLGIVCYFGFQNGWKLPIEWKFLKQGNNANLIRLSNYYKV